MPYLTSDDLRDRVGGVDALRQLTDDDQNEAPDTSVIALFLTGVESEFDSYFRAGGYTVPVSSDAFAPVKRYALDIVNYRLKTRGDRQASEGDRQLYEDALAYFRLVAGRKVLLIVVAGGNAAFALESNAPIFSSETMAGF